jgi:hypothetical protein
MNASKARELFRRTMAADDPPRYGRAWSGCPDPTRYPQLPSAWIVRDDQISQICVPDELHCHTESDAPNGGSARGYQELPRTVGDPRHGRAGSGRARMFYA